MILEMRTFHAARFSGEFTEREKSDYDAVSFRLITGASFTFVGENTAREKSMMYLTVFKQNGHGVSRTSGFSSVLTFSGNDRRHSVQVITI